MNYKLKFLPSALKAFKKLDGDTKLLLKKALKKRLIEPKIEKHRLHGDWKGHYKIKLKQKGYLLIYRVLDKEVIVLVVDIDRRDTIYKKSN